MGFPWAIYNPSDVYGPLQAHVYGRDESMGVLNNPRKNIRLLIQANDISIASIGNPQSDSFPVT